MKSIASFFQLIRWKNLLIVAITQWVIWYFVINPLNAVAEQNTFLNAFNFALLSISTLLIAAAGYIINDYFDIKIDLINRPQKVIIEHNINRRSAMLWHTFFNIAGFAIACFLAYKMQQYWVVLIQLSCTVLLWFYSTHFKRQFVSGNVIVAILTALTILIIGIYEPLIIQYARKPYFLFTHSKWVVNPFWVIVVYAYFAFMLTWMREVVKDMEDYKGDAEDGCVTMPIKIGLKKSSDFIITLGITAILPLLIAVIKLISSSNYTLSIYIILALIAPLIGWIIFLKKRITTAHYALCSKYLKFIMLSGIFSLVVYYFTL